MNNYIPSINESINAKTTSFRDLCSSFIVNEYYERLASSSNTILVGPRGSGKTTLMRMLEVRSLEHWEAEEAKLFRRKVSFSGVFIPTDRLWKRQYDNAKDKVKNHEDSLVLSSQFIYHILEQLVQSISFRTSRTLKLDHNFRHVELSKQDEVELVSCLAKQWHVKPHINSLKGLVISIALKKSEVSNYISDISFKKSTSEAPKVVSADISEVLNTSITIINTYLNENGEKWAFLFDELELAPDEIIQPLIDCMRGGHQDIILKLALSPYHKGINITNSPESSMKNQDLSYIDLTDISEKEGLKFATSLCTKMLIGKGIFSDIESCFISPDEIAIDQVFHSLCQKDADFYQYLNSKGFLGINYSDVEPTRRPQFRKVKFIAYLRDLRRNNSGQKQARRRPADYYAGFENICKSTEFNPRMIIGIMNMFIPIIKDRNRVTISEQISGLQSYFESFRSLLSTIAIDSSDGRINNIYDLVDKIAWFFNNEIYGDKFSSQPKGVIVLDRDTPRELGEAIGLALNAGALISTENSDSKGGDLTNESINSCRLSYLFSHHYGLLLTQQGPIDLSRIMKSKDINSGSIRVVRTSNYNDDRQFRLELK
ncbi:hypothetical protein swp_1008 [Shewanella piezotolerans WP3]|uniref:Uncharacterized protein n=1 Tax=Shewanella piezotolerans (strain WP3 / JCM 13877) TaxID=225849 RepID=B8CJ49_SHEPW|nr:hypothetical protein [Shewanella piezotolerans]ACJ27811.1 hypothetical protein swp_1008 [Shewanella piezotolerans WP3]